MSSEKRNTEKKVADFAASRLFGDLQKVASVTVTSEDGTEREVMVPIDDDGVTEGTKRGALEYARTLRRIDDAWKYEPTSEELEHVGRHLAKLASFVVVQNLLRVGAERFGVDTFGTGLGDAFLSDQDAFLNAAAGRHEKVLFDALDADGLARIVGQLERNIAAAVLQDFEEEHGLDALEAMSADEYDELFTAAYAEMQGEHRVNFTVIYAQDVARTYLEELKPSEATLDRLVALLRAGPKSDALAIATHSLPGAMTRGLIHHGLWKDHEIRVKEDGRDHFAKVRTEVALDVPSEAALEKQESMLLDMQRALLQNKEQSAANLKMHLDLMDQAYGAGDEPTFLYRLDDALERQGYRRQKKGSFHHTTLRNARERLELMYRHRVTAWKLKNESVGDVLIAKTPYWIIEETYYTRQGSLDLDVMPSAYRLGQHDHFSGALIRPGGWWKYARMSAYFLPVPREILRLQTDGRGNERERMALLIATYLATYVRTNQKGHAGKRKAIGVGTLLEKSGITTRDALFDMESWKARRVREYLLDEGGSGALAIIHDLGAFDIDLRDWSDFYDRRKGWRERFWDAQLDVLIPDLGFAKKQIKAGEKRRRA
jgi:hypothetical protein